MIRIVVDSAHPDPDAIERSALSIGRGGVVAIPTDTLYGLAVDPTNRLAIARIFELKARPAERALPLVAADTAQVREWFADLTPLAGRLADRFWPGPLTLVIRAPHTLAGVANDRGAVGVRVPAHAVTRALCAACGRPLTATSANISGEPPTDNPEHVAAQFGETLDLLLLDAGLTPGGPPSTVVDVTERQPQLIRSGAISWERVEECARQK